MKSNELKSIGLSAGLVLANIALMAAVSVTPLSQVTNLLFKIPIIGMIIFGAGLMAGRYLAKKGLKENSTGLAATGAGILELTYGVFGGGILSLVPSTTLPVVIGLTAAVTTGIAILAALLVYSTGKNFRSWRRYSNYLFMGAFGTGLVGSAFAPLLLLTFVLVLAGFIVYLVYEIWNMKTSPKRVVLNGIGIYIAYMGVFVEILQIVIQMLADR